MQYSVQGTDGNQYGPVDLQTLKKWVTEGRVLPNTQITDSLANRSMIASQMPELSLQSPGVQGGYAGQVPAPPTYQQYPRTDAQYQQPQQHPYAIRGSVIGSIIFRLILAIGISTFTQMGGLLFSTFNVYYAVRALLNKDPKGNLCVVISVLGLIGIGIWTMYKITNRINSY